MSVNLSKYLPIVSLVSPQNSQVIIVTKEKYAEITLHKVLYSSDITHPIYYAINGHL